MAILKEERIGGQRLILGDCLEVMPFLLVDHIITDPPYEQRLHDSKNKAKGPTRNDNGPDLRGLNFVGIDNVRSEFVSAVEKICRGWLLAFCTIEGTAYWANAINKSQLKYKRACTWVKPDSTPQLNGQCPAQGTEHFITAWCGAGHSKWNAGGKRGVYTHNTNSRDRDGRHPTEKPQLLMIELLRDFSNVGQTILDPFMGSGTTLVACEKLGRSGTGIELDPDYFEIACQRVEEASRQPRDMFIDASKKNEVETVDMFGGDI